MTQEHEVRKAVKFTKVARQGVGCQGLGAGGGAPAVQRGQSLRSGGNVLSWTAVTAVQQQERA